MCGFEGKIPIWILNFIFVVLFHVSVHDCVVELVLGFLRVLLRHLSLRAGGLIRIYEL